MGAGRDAVQRYQHIYFLDRSRCPLSDFERIWRGLGDSGVDGLKVQLQTKGRVPARGLYTGRGGPGGAEILEIEKAHESNGGERLNVIHFNFFW